MSTGRSWIYRQQNNAARGLHTAINLKNRTGRPMIHCQKTANPKKGSHSPIRRICTSSYAQNLPEHMLQNWKSGWQILALPEHMLRKFGRGYMGVRHAVSCGAVENPDICRGSSCGCAADTRHQNSDEVTMALLSSLVGRRRNKQQSNMIIYFLTC